MHVVLKPSVCSLHERENPTCYWVPVLRVKDFRPQYIDIAPELDWEIPYVDSQLPVTPARVDNRVLRRP